MGEFLRRENRKRWTPRRSGNRFCSPACGAGCTHSDYVAATKAARKLAHTLGPGWKPCVWENMAWHYEAVSGVARIGPSIDRNQSPPRIDGYTCYFNTKKQFTTRAKTPAAALRRAIKEAREHIDAVLGDLEAVEG